MHSCTKDESDSLETLLLPVNINRFQSAIRRLNNRFNVCVSTCPEPLPAPGLIVTKEIRAQCERYLPIAEVAAVFNHLYSAALTHQPILSSTPFYNSMSWADTFAALPAELQFSANPARLIEALLADVNLLTRFLFASFLPDCFYGRFGRYPGQQNFIKDWLTKYNRKTLRCLDAACGIGEASYDLAHLLAEKGFSPEEIRIDGWTLEPLEVWAATHRCFPHDSHRESWIRAVTATIFESGYGRCISFSCKDILKLSRSYTRIRGNHVGLAANGGFDLILCNGLLGGPIIHELYQLDRVIGNLSQQLLPEGILLVADRFHGGWKQKCPQAELRALLEKNRLIVFEAGEGIGGLKSD